MAEDLADYLNAAGIKVRYLHSDVKTLERMEIIQDLRMGKFDVLIGINLLREGLDIPEVSLVAILDADKEGFLRSARSLIQTFGRAARNAKGRVILYADQVTRAMKTAMDETNRRRQIQMDYNEINHIVPTTIQKEINPVFAFDAQNKPASDRLKVAEDLAPFDNLETLNDTIIGLEKEMQAAAKKLEFEKAAALRDQIKALKKTIIFER